MRGRSLFDVATGEPKRECKSTHFCHDKSIELEDKNKLISCLSATARTPPQSLITDWSDCKHG